MKCLKTIYALTIYALCSFFVVFVAEARWCKPEDADVVYEFFNRDVAINEDGSYEEIVSLRVKILKESGRDEFSRYRRSYNSNAEKMTILDAKTIYNGKQYRVAKGMIEDKPLASSGPGFDQLNQVTIAFPKVVPGSEVCLKYKRMVKKIPVKNFYGNVLYYDFGYIKASKVSIASKLPLNIKVNNPKAVLNVAEATKNGIHNIHITLEKPLYEHTTNEPQNLISEKYKTWISLSSLNNWEDLAKEFVAGYRSVINQPLPEEFNAIAEAAIGNNSNEEQINFVTSALNEQITYMGDLRTVEGSFFPRDLKQIAHSQIGDCKDFSTVTAAILQQLGYKVMPVFVNRGIAKDAVQVDTLLPSTVFNHAMLKAMKGANTYWIDPTNTVSMAQGIFPDIEDRDALVIDYQEAVLTKIPSIQHHHSKKIYHHTIDIINNDVVNQKGTVTLQGESALPATGLGLFYSNEQLRDTFFRFISGTLLAEEEKKFLELPDLTLRSVKDLHIAYELQQKNKIFKTNLGSAFTLRVDDWFDKVVYTTDDQISSVFIDIPHTIEIQCIIKDRHIKNCKNLNFKITSPWLSVTRLCKYQGKDTEITDIVVIVKSFIENEELKSVEYKKLKHELESNFRDVAIVVG